MQPRVADFYVPQIYSDLTALGSAAPSIAAAVWPTANRAFYVPVIFPYPCTLTSVSFIAGNGTGNYDLGLYDGYSKAKLASTGSTAMTAAGTKTLTFSSPIRSDAGRLYYAAVTLSSTSGTAIRVNTAIVLLIAAGFAQESSLPLNATMTPVTIASAYTPFVVFGIR